jgi:hypothetical protein
MLVYFSQVRRYSDEVEGTLKALQGAEPHHDKAWSVADGPPALGVIFCKSPMSLCFT